MTARIKDVTLDGKQAQPDYQVRKLLPAVGGYIWQKLMAAVYKANRVAGFKDEEAQQNQAPADESAPKLVPPTPEDRMRALCGIAFMQLDFDDYVFVQNSCMKASSRLLNGLPMPVMTDSGQWTVDGQELQDDPFLATRLMVEALVFSLCPYLAERG